MDMQGNFLDQLFASGLLIESGVDGLYGRSGVFEDVVTRFDALVTRYGEDDGAEVVRFPPGMSRPNFEKSGYLKSFPQLAGTVHSFCGDDHGHNRIIECLAAGEDWTDDQKATDIVLTPAACYPLYPVIAKRGPLPEDGRLFDLQSYCFRHEPSKEPTRMQLFRMREYVRAGRPNRWSIFASAG
ncbi:Amino acid--[acyl-carrier-protein] ligase [Methylobrevis pamukkalensis]|uniref:Amino acid--[acyl-carrier-protein] ligase n=1 Tax=Methylobrevis pamukkalensis TaxID=1439726 RepID=A0A1E3GP91_9HYPH|nr:Amino acid--[acyl-carrier-protein] ligase [Methylobrevis pamukkalensis]